MESAKRRVMVSAELRLMMSYLEKKKKKKKKKKKIMAPFYGGG